MEDIQIYTYEELDRKIKLTMRRSAADMVEIGYLLRHMMEEKLWERKHSCFDEYLDKELHMDYTMASRFIKANKKYSDNEDGMKIDTKWMDYSQSVLIEMLNMPPELEEKVTPDMTVKQVREVKKQKSTKMKPDVRGILADPYCAACGEPLDDSKQPQKCPNCGQGQDWEWYDRVFNDKDQSQETVIDGEYKEINETEVATSQDSESAKPDAVLPDKYETAVHDGVEPSKKTIDEITRIRDILEKEKKLLSEYKSLGNIPEDTMFRQKTIVGALANMVCELENMPKEGRQQELPIMKNDHQRTEWLRNYKEWGRWYRDDNIDVNYYKYDFSDGSRLIVAEYPQRTSIYGNKPEDEYYFHFQEKSRKNYGGGTFTAQYCQDTDSETYIVDFLKNLKKKGKS